MDVKKRASAAQAPSSEAQGTRAVQSGLTDPLRRQQSKGDALQDPLRGFGGGAGRAAPASRRVVPGSKFELAGRRAWVTSMDGEVERAGSGEVKFNDAGRLVLRVVSGERSLEVVIDGAAGEVIALTPRIAAVEAKLAEKESQAAAAAD